MPDRALSSETLGAWLVKASGRATGAALDQRLGAGTSRRHPRPRAHHRAGSNPSYVTPAQLDVLVAMREELAERV